MSLPAKGYKCFPFHIQIHEIHYKYQNIKKCILAFTSKRKPIYYSNNIRKLWWRTRNKNNRFVPYIIIVIVKYLASYHLLHSSMMRRACIWGKNLIRVNALILFNLYASTIYIPLSNTYIFIRWMHKHMDAIHMYMYVHMYICIIHTHVCICTYIDIYTHVFIPAYVNKYKDIFLFTYKKTELYIHVTYPIAT